MDYKERHIEMGKLYPVVLFKHGRIRIDFIAQNTIKHASIRNLVGPEIYINKVENFEFLMENKRKINIKYKNKKYGIFCPEPVAFLLHKCVTFIDRDEKEKQAKDLYYAYFILRYAPEEIFKDIKKYNKNIILKVFENIKKYFNFKTSNACMVERECGNDYYIEDLRGDIFERFNKFAKILK